MLGQHSPRFEKFLTLVYWTSKKPGNTKYTGSFLANGWPNQISQYESVDDEPTQPQF
jgi:hypothetical protein